MNFPERHPDDSHIRRDPVPTVDQLRTALCALPWNSDCKDAAHEWDSYSDDVLLLVAQNWHDECEIGRLVKAMVAESLAQTVEDLNDE